MIMKFKSEKQREYKFRKAIYYLNLDTNIKLEQILKEYNYNPNDYVIKIKIYKKEGEK